MAGIEHAQIQDHDWNVLTSSWLEVQTINAEHRTISALEALKGAGSIRCIASSSPLDYFAAHRFLLTLLYWKADPAGGVRGQQRTEAEI